MFKKILVFSFLIISTIALNCAEPSPKIDVNFSQPSQVLATIAKISLKNTTHDKVTLPWPDIAKLFICDRSWSRSCSQTVIVRFSHKTTKEGLENYLSAFNPNLEFIVSQDQICNFEQTILKIEFNDYICDINKLDYLEHNLKCKILLSCDGCLSHGPTIVCLFNEKLDPKYIKELSRYIPLSYNCSGFEILKTIWNEN
ncbi:MAG: hypothetical protein P4L22_07215 [Candidatus Babeliales bacterium]|nr:hypothetical protein [Candidatus Babeliales bacterium]